MNTKQTEDERREVAKASSHGIYYATDEAEVWYDERHKDDKP